MARRAITIAAAISIVLLAGTARAQGQTEPQMTPEQKAEMDAYVKAGTPGAPHQALAVTAGSYNLKVRSWHEPNGQATEDKGTATRSMILDGRVLAESVHSQMMGQPWSGHGMTGYDNVTGKYWSTWNDSMTTGLMLAEGTCDAKLTCTFTGSSTDPLTKKAHKLRMTTRWTSPTSEIFEMYGPDKSGKEFKMLEITYTRK
jgi:hypothetical protein